MGKLRAGPKKHKDYCHNYVWHYDLFAIRQAELPLCGICQPEPVFLQGMCESFIIMLARIMGAMAPETYLLSPLC